MLDGVERRGGGESATERKELCNPEAERDAGKNVGEASSVVPEQKVVLVSLSDDEDVDDDEKPEKEKHSVNISHTYEIARKSARGCQFAVQFDTLTGVPPPGEALPVAGSTTSSSSRGENLVVQDGSVEEASIGLQLRDVIARIAFDDGTFDEVMETFWDE